VAECPTAYTALYGVLFSVGWGGQWRRKSGSIESVEPRLRASDADFVAAALLTVRPSPPYSAGKSHHGRNGNRKARGSSCHPENAAETRSQHRGNGSPTSRPNRVLRKTVTDPAFKRGGGVSYPEIPCATPDAGPTHSNSSKRSPAGTFPTLDTVRVRSVLAIKSTQSSAGAHGFLRTLATFRRGKPPTAPSRRMRVIPCSPVRSGRGT
jgi:hypothetical protein